MQNKKLKILQSLLAVLFLLITIFSISYLSSESQHNCTEENCPVCFVIHVVKANLELLVLNLAICSALFHFRRIKKYFLSYVKYSQITNSLISQKVRLND